MIHTHRSIRQLDGAFIPFLGLDRGGFVSLFIVRNPEPFLGVKHSSLVNDVLRPASTQVLRRIVTTHLGGWFLLSLLVQQFTGGDAVAQTENELSFSFSFGRSAE